MDEPEYGIRMERDSRSALIASARSESKSQQHDDDDRLPKTVHLRLNRWQLYNESSNGSNAFTRYAAQARVRENGRF